MIICECSKDDGFEQTGRGNTGVRETGYPATSKIQKRLGKPQKCLFHNFLMILLHLNLRENM